MIILPRPCRRRNKFRETMILPYKPPYAYRLRIISDRLTRGALAGIGGFAIFHFVKWWLS